MIGLGVAWAGTWATGVAIDPTKLGRTDDTAHLSWNAEGPLERVAGSGVGATPGVTCAVAQGRVGVDVAYAELPADLALPHSTRCSLGRHTLKVELRPMYERLRQTLLPVIGGRVTVPVVPRGAIVRVAALPPLEAFAPTDPVPIDGFTDATCSMTDHIGARLVALRVRTDEAP